MSHTINACDFRVQAKPLMRDEYVLQGEHWRIGVITESLVRFEWSDDGVFEDRPTQTVLNRQWREHVECAVSERDGLLVIDTPALTVTYDRKPFSKEGLSVVIKGLSNTQFNTWHYGDDAPGNLRGTARTLDEADGAIPLGEGVISRDGWAVLDDSASNVLVEAAQVNGVPNPYGVWVEPRQTRTTDLYFFGYGHRYREAIQDFYRLTGPTPLLPRFVFGNWWSRYHRYTQDEYVRLMDRFVEERVPLTTAVIDMDWHLVDDVDPKYGSGWTGYTWNREFFPDHRAFLEELHRRGLRTTLNVHPRDGVRAFEEPYEQVARHMGMDPSTGEPVEFDITNPRFVEAYFDMHHDLEDEGVDFWWLDWQQGGVTRQPGLDPLWMLNHMHYLDSGRDGRWPLTFSRYAGPGSHRYPVGFSGDTVVSWESLQFQPYFTAAASNVGYGWWSHDIGGHMFGKRDGELEVRWYQLGAFSPINRLHSTDSPFNGKEPWNFPGEVRQAMDEALRLRHELIPYLYAMNWRAASEGLPLVEPMYWQDPDTVDAYDVPTQFRFGTELIVSPVVEQMDKEARRGKANMWFPQGVWYDFFDGRRYVSAAEGGRRMAVWRGLDRVPVFAKAGGIVPMQIMGDGDSLNNVDNPHALRVIVFPGANGRFVITEDDGKYQANPADMRTARTELSFDWTAQGGSSHEGAATFSIAPAQGEAAVLPTSRSWDIVLRGVAQAEARVVVDGSPVDCGVSYDEATLSVTVHVPAQSVRSRIVVTFGESVRETPDTMEQDAFDLLFQAEMLYLTKEKAMHMVRTLGRSALASLPSLEQGPRDGKRFFASHMPQAVADALAEIMLRY